MMSIEIDMLHPIDPSSLDIREVREATGGKFALCGNVNQAFPLAFGSPEGVCLETLRMLRDIAPGGGYLLGSGHSCQDYLRPENYLAMIDTALEFGRYSIDIPDATLRAAEQAAEQAPRHFDLSYENMPEQPALARFYERIIT